MRLLYDTPPNTIIRSFMTTAVCSRREGGSSTGRGSLNTGSLSWAGVSQGEWARGCELEMFTRLQVCSSRSYCSTAEQVRRKSAPADTPCSDTGWRMRSPYAVAADLPEVLLPMRHLLSR